GTEYAVDFVPKVKLEVVVDDDRVQAAIDAVLKAAHTGQIGDGKVFVANLENAVRIRTGETGGEASEPAAPRPCPFLCGGPPARPAAALSRRRPPVSRRPLSRRPP